jgi:hypothetical protein
MICIHRNRLEKDAKFIENVIDTFSQKPSIIIQKNNFYVLVNKS